MLFVELRYLLFLAAVVVVYHSLASHRAQKWLLLLTSYAFYAAWDYRFLSLVFVSTGVDYLVGVKMQHSSDDIIRRRWMSLSLCANLGLLGFFKYWNFFLDSAVALGGRLGVSLDLPLLQIVLPVGISFYTFQTLSYTIDIYRRNLKAADNLMDFALYVAFFPQLVAGPISRAGDFLPQLKHQVRWSQIDVRAVVVLFWIGFFKKAIISEHLAPFVNQYFAAPQSYGAGASWIATLFYSVQIYCDFSGYTDMALASATLLGFHLMQNFDTPYFARNIADFWRRWHISLSTWLRDYLYVSLGGNRNGPAQVYRNLMLTMVLGGLWHGASWNFVFWGFLHGIALVAHRRFGSRDPSNDSWLRRLVFTAMTYYWVCLAWIFFRNADWTSAVQAATSFVTLTSPGTGTPGLPLHWGWAVMALLTIGHLVLHRTALLRRWQSLSWPAFAIVTGILCSLTIQLLPGAQRPFIYFQF